VGVGCWCEKFKNPISRDSLWAWGAGVKNSKTRFPGIPPLFASRKNGVFGMLKVEFAKTPLDSA